MKKLFTTIIALCAITVTAHAQLKVAANGNVAIHSTGTPLSDLAIGCTGDTIYAITNQCTNSGVLHYISTIPTGENTGALFMFDRLGRVGYSTGMMIYDTGTSDSRYLSVDGINSVVGNASTCTGLYGSIGDCTRGAAVYGTTTGSTWSSYDENHCYAGYFQGDTKITSNLIVGGSIQGVLLGESTGNQSELRSINDLSQENTPILNKLSNLQVSQYQAVREQKPASESDEEFMNKLSEAYSHRRVPLKIVEEAPNIVSEQYACKKHYGLSAEQLEKEFPDLVYEREDGTKGINYMEMVPLLVQCINELTDELMELKGENGKVKKEKQTASVATPNKNREACLCQNSPNPFTGQTEIRFSLPTDTKNAYIFICDMQGKMVKQVPVTPTENSITIEGYNLIPGLYLYSLVVDGQEIDTKRMIVSK